MGRDEQGYAWASQAGAVLSNPFASELARDSEIYRPLCYSNGPALSLRAEIVGRKCGVALGLQAGMCCEKASASPLVSVFSTTNPAFAQRIKPVIISVFLFDSFVPTHLIRRFSQPAPPSELPCGSLYRLVPKSRFALWAKLRLLLIRASLRRLTLRSALAVSRAAAQPPGSAHLPRCLVVVPK